MKTLDQLMASVRSEGQRTDPDPSDLDLLLYSPCPVKLAVKERLDAIARQAEEAGDPVRIHIPMGCTSVDPYDPLHMETDPDQLPDIIASIGFGDFFRAGFRERFVDTGLFEAVLPEQVHPLHQAAGLVDPLGRYTVYAPHALHLSRGYRPPGRRAPAAHLGGPPGAALQRSDQHVRRRRRHGRRGADVRCTRNSAWKASRPWRPTPRG